MRELDSADSPDTDDEAAKRADLAPEEALKLLRDGKPIENARIRRLRLSGEFEHPVQFKNCQLIQPEFRSATFLKAVVISRSTIERGRFTKRNTFHESFTLAGSTIHRTIFGGLIVKGEFNSARARYRAHAAFKDCTFHDVANFWEATFETWIDFTACRFQGMADFRSCHCEQGFVASKNTIFHKDFLFRGTTVQKKLDLDNTTFEGCLDLSKAKLHDFVYLEAIRQGPNQSFSFLNTVAERIRVQPNQVEGRLQSEHTGRHEDAMQEYGLLKKCYSSLHRFDHEDWAFYRFKVAQRKSKPIRWSRPWTLTRSFADWLFLDVGCGYGTNPIRAVRMATAIILGFAILYGLNVELFYTEKLPFPDASRTDLINRAMIGLTTSVSVFTSGMGGIREIARGWMNVPVMIESIMGTLLFGLFIVAFSRKVIR